jgi:hypothetical protein
MFEWSIERLDNSRGHVRGNVCLVCVRFQSGDSSQHRDDHDQSAQWTRAKFFRAVQLAHAGDALEEPPALQQDKKAKSQSVFDESGRKLCNYCLEHKELDAFNRNKTCQLGRLARCRGCVAKWNATFKGCLMNKRGHAKNRAPTDFAFDGDNGLELLRKKWIDQGGRGYYTGIPLRHTPTKDWVMSLERLNQSDPRYTLENTVIEVVEANTPKQWSGEFASATLGVGH